MSAKTEKIKSHGDLIFSVFGQGNRQLLSNGDTNTMHVGVLGGGAAGLTAAKTLLMPFCENSARNFN